MMNGAVGCLVILLPHFEGDVDPKKHRALWGHPNAGVDDAALIEVVAQHLFNSNSGGFVRDVDVKARGIKIQNSCVARRP